MRVYSVFQYNFTGRIIKVCDNQMMINTLTLKPAHTLICNEVMYVV